VPAAVRVALAVEARVLAAGIAGAQPARAAASNAMAVTGLAQCVSLRVTTCHARSVAYHVSTDEFERIAATALDSIPAGLRDRLAADNLMIVIQPGASADDRDHDIDERVLGFYEGAAESAFSVSPYPKRIVLLQGHIEAYCSSHRELVDQVTDTMLHEVAHYFGLDHDDIRGTRLHH
jgi:predicted Zn-dependent protease with MMP-like domain